jgi:frataxin-like iron-binding protein CyaY
MEHVLYVFLVFAVGFLVGWNEREKWASRRVDALLNMFNEEVERQAEESRIDIKIEKHEGGFYVFNKDTNEFMAQGQTRKQLEDALAARFSGKRFYADVDNLKEVGLKG